MKMESNKSYSLADEMAEILNNEERSVEKIAKISPGGRNDKKIPTLNNAQWVLSALGYNLTLEKKSTTEEAGEKEE